MKKILKAYLFSVFKWIALKKESLRTSYIQFCHPNLEMPNSFKAGSGFKLFLGNNASKLVIKEYVEFRNYCSVRVENKAKLTISKNVFFNNFCSINCMMHISIGDYTIFGEGVKIYDHNHKYLNETGLIKIERDQFKTAAIKIGQNCWIGSNVTILKGVEIGDNVIVGANNLIYKSIPSNTIIKGKTDYHLDKN